MKSNPTTTLNLGLHERQGVAALSPATEILFGGGVGGGKSHLLRVVAIRSCMEVAGLNAYLFRRLYPDLMHNHMQGPGSFPEILAPLVNAKKCRIVEKEIRFWNGSKILLNHLQHEKNVFSFQGQEIHLLLFDELTHFTETSYRYLRTRCRLGGLKLPAKYRGLFPRIISGSNPGGIGHCVKKGEVWTEAGWRDIWNIKPGDMVYSRTECGTIELRKVSQIHHSRAAELTRYDRRGLTIEATAEHKVGTMVEGKMRLTRISDFPGQVYIARSARWEGREIGHVEIEGEKTYRQERQPLHVTGRQYCALAGWTVTEGCSGEYSPGDYRWKIAQMKEPQRSDIRTLLTECGFKFTEDAKGFNIASKSWQCHWSKVGKGCRFKRVPEIIHSASADEIECFIDAAMQGDGHWVKRGISGQFYTTSKGLADDVQSLAMKAGYITHLSSRERHNRLGLSYCLSLRRCERGQELLTGNHRYKVSTKTKRSKRAKTVKGGPVVCIGVEETHNFFIRQNGSVWISGNSWVKKTFVNHGANQIFRCPKKEGGMLRQFIPSLLSDNPTMSVNDPDYESRLLGAGDPVIVRALLEGDWSIVAGAVFGDRWRHSMHTCDKFAIPDHWALWRGADDGYAAPASVHWLTQDPGTKTIYVIDELYRSQMRPETMARLIMEKDRKIEVMSQEGRKYLNSNILPGIMDSAAFADTGTQEGIPRGNSLNKLGCKFKPCEKWPGSRIHRIQNFHRLMGPNPRDPVFDEHGKVKFCKPGIRFFREKCPVAIDIIPTLPRDKDDAEDIDDNADDHAFDSVSYGTQYKLHRHGSRAISGL